MALTKVPTSLFAERAALRTPYEYGALPGSEMSVDNTPYVQALMDAWAASWSATDQRFGIIPNFAGVMFRCDGEIYLNDVQQPGGVIYGNGGGIHSRNENGVALNAMKTNQIKIIDFQIYGDPNNPPDVGIAYGRANGGGIAPGMYLFGFFTRGYFNKAPGINLASETGAHIVCYFQNDSPVRTATAFMWADNVAQIDARLTGGSATFQGALDVGGNSTAWTSTASNLGHKLVGSHYKRGTASRLTMVAVTKPGNIQIEVAAGTLSGSGYANGTEVGFSFTQGVPDLETGGIFTITNIDTANDTFELSSTSGLSAGSFTSGQVVQASGPAVVISSVQQFSMEGAYLLAYNDSSFTLDLTNERLRDFYIQFQPEADNKHSTEIILPGTGNTAIVTGGFNWINLNASQKIGSTLFKMTGAGDMQIRGGKISLATVPTPLPTAIFDDASGVALLNTVVEMPVPDFLNAASDYVAYDVTEIAYGRFPRRHEYFETEHYESPTFRVTGANFITASFESVGSNPPYFASYFNEATPTTGEIGRWVMRANNDADELTEFANINAQAVAITDGAEEGRINFNVKDAGANVSAGYVTKNGVFTLGGVRTLGNYTATSTELEDITDAINTDNKYIGKPVWNTTTGRPVYAVSSTAGGVWNDATGTTAHTPS